jgi:hypothetical protein
LIPPRKEPSSNIKRIATDKEMWPNLIHSAKTIVKSATIEPGLRSMPPVNITRVDPIAIKETTLTCNARLPRLFTSKNLSVVNDTRIATTMAAAKGPMI